MDKETLKSVLGAMKVSDIFSINFVGEHKSLSGQYKLLKIAKGKGKGGSLVMEALNVSTGKTLDTLNFPNKGKTHKLGTAVSEVILNITLNGVTHGSQNESELAKAFGRSKEAAEELAKILAPLVGKTTPTKLAISSTEAPDLNGTWLVTDAKKSAGRYGQVILQMVDVNNPANTRELWSYRHASVIDSIEDVEENSDKV